MFLKRIEISGFKSFAAKTTLDFLAGAEKGKNPGITAIVGPNGSGKSNIADALRWVMGEQSMKNLRGKKSEDIIFAGSGKKARLGSAQVKLILDNSDSRMPLEFGEVSISRKIFRSGESQYCVNGSNVRLQDVVDILAKAGVGKESYAIINQGMADSVLNASPLERRSIIEDAAGVKQYQIKKERSTRKLESTRQNLLRVKDLTEEIKPHLNMLKRQAQKASQSESVARELNEKQTLLFSYLWQNFQKEKETFNEAKEEVGRTMNNMQREVDKLTDEMGAWSKEEVDSSGQRELENKQREERNKQNQLERELIITEGRVEIEKEKQKNTQALEELKNIQPDINVAVDLQYVRSGIEEIRKDQETLVERIEKAEKMEDLQDIKEFARVIQQRLYDLKIEIEKGKKIVSEKKEEKEQKKKQKTEEAVSKVLVGFEKRLLEIKEDIKKSEAEIKKIDAEIQKMAETNREKRQKFFELEAVLRKKQEEVGRLKDQFNESKIALAKVEVREEDLRKQVKDEIKKNVEELEIVKEEINRAVLESEIGKLKIKMEQIGGIDPAVIDEFNDVSKRFEFLTKESEDLEKAGISLKEVIKEMDQKIDKKFAATYEEINKEFSKYFRIIFGGGNARLAKLKIESRKSKAKDLELNEENYDGEEEEEGSRLIGDLPERQEEDQIGIDITACPPGKKISSLAMLSGGERSLTSIALLFAIISHNPPPFAILDEVEAALDEANSKRFGRILTELSGSTQFVTITHNRETMRQASLLYGVTMGEDGISKLLSVRLDQIGSGGRIMK